MSLEMACSKFRTSQVSTFHRLVVVAIHLAEFAFCGIAQLRFWQLHLLLCFLQLHLLLHSLLPFCCCCCICCVPAALPLLLPHRIT